MRSARSFFPRSYGALGPKTIPFPPYAAFAFYPASTVALEDTLCLLIRKQDFYALLEAHPSLVRSLLHGFASFGGVPLVAVFDTATIPRSWP